MKKGAMIFHAVLVLFAGHSSVIQKKAVSNRSPVCPPIDE